MKAAWQMVKASLEEHHEIDLFRQIAEKANVGIAITDISGNLFYTNQALLDMHGYSEEEVLGEHFVLFFSERQELRAKQILKKIVGSGCILLEEIPAVKKNGDELPVLLNANVINDSNDNPAFISATIVDLTQKVLADQSYKRHEALYRALFDTAPMGIGVTNMKGDILMANKHLMEISQASMEELKAANMKDVYTSAGDRAKLIKGLKEKGKVEDFETVIENARGRRIPINVNASLFPEMEETMMVAVKDISEQKENEEKLNLAIEKLSEANLDMKVFTETVSNDLKEPLKYIESYCEIFSDLYGEKLDDKGVSFLNKIVNSCNRMRHSIEDVLNLSLAVRHDLDIKKYNISEIFEYQCNSLALKVKDLSAEFTIQPDLYMLCDRDMMVILAENILKSLVLLVPDGSSVEVCFLKNPDGSFSLEADSLLFSPSEAKHLFQHSENYSQDEVRYKAGLAIARRVISRHGGSIRAESNPETKKSAITFNFPE